MKTDDFVKAMTYLGMAYNKEFKEQELKQYYEFLKNIKYETFKEIIKKVIKTHKYMPSINELLEESELIKFDDKKKIIEKMKEDGYFKSPKEIDKIYKFLEEGIIPSWFLEDMKKYGYQDELEYSKNKLLNQEGK